MIMNNGFVPVATASPRTRVADPMANAELCCDAIVRAANAGAKVVALPEVVLTSYIADDMLYHDIVLDAAEEALAHLVAETAKLDVVFSVGLPLCVNGKIYNTLAICHAGEIMGVIPKTYIPTYGVDFEGRWFSSGPADVTYITVAGQEHVPFGSHQVFRCRQMPQLCLGYEICEDIWSPDPPSIHLALAGATIICNGSASNASLEKDLYRRSLISGQSARLLCCYAYCSSGQGDSTGDVTVGGQEIIAENGSILAQAEPFGDGFAIADVDVESLWGARRGMSSFHVEPTPQYADYHETMFDMTIPDHPLMRPVSKQPFIPADEKMRADCCSLAVTMQAHGLAARVGAQNADHLVIDTTNSSVTNTALAMLAVARFYDLERPAVPDMYVAISQDVQNGQSANVKLIEQLADALGLPLATLASAQAAQQDTAQSSPEHPVLDIQELIGDTSWLIVNPSDMTQLALGLVQFPFDLGRQYGINSQIAHTFVPVILRQYAQECAEGNLQTLLGAICDADDELHIPEHDTVSMSESAELGPAIVEDFYLDGFLRAQYRPAKTFALAKQAFAGEYGEHELLVWMKAFYERFFGSQFLRHSLPDGTRIGSAELDLRDGFMMPTYAQSTLWMNEVDALLNAAAK